MRRSHDIAAVVLVKNDEYWLPFALKAAFPYFQRFVIHDVGSTDRTADIIRTAVDAFPEKEFFVKFWPDLPTPFQGELRNSMIAETKAEYYFILDADEVYSPESYELIARSPELFVGTDKVYGVVRRVEVGSDLKQAYGQGQFVPHHRVYHRTCLWTGPHPGEIPVTPQNRDTALVIEGATCFHFHGTERSTRDEEVPKRLERRKKQTYTPGELQPIDILAELPILKERIGNFPLNPALERLGCS